MANQFPFGGSNVQEKTQKPVKKHFTPAKKKTSPPDLKKVQTPGLNGTAQNSETIAFNKALLLAKRNGLNPKKAFQLGSSKGDLLETIGSHKIIILGSIIQKIMSKDKAHCLTWNHLINLPDNINNPLAIFKSKTSGYVILTEIKNELEKPLMVAIHFNTVFKVQDIRSIYSKDNDKTYKEWKEKGLLLYENKKSKLFDRVLGLIPKSSNKMLSKSKDTKKGLNCPNPIKKPIKKPKPVAKLPANIDKNSLAYKMANQNKEVEYFIIPDKDISRLLGKIEKKAKDSVFISLTGGEGSMKTRQAFQFMNTFAQNYKVGHASIEEHPESVLYFDKAKQYLDTKAQGNITNPEVNNLSSLHNLILKNDVIVIDSFTKMKEIEKSFEVDRDLRKKYNGKLFIVIFQQTTGNKMRGGSKSQFDADIVLFTEKFDDYKQNYVYATKNRYSSETGLKFNIYQKQLQNGNSEQISGTEVQPKTKKLSFKVK